MPTPAPAAVQAPPASGPLFVVLNTASGAGDAARVQSSIRAACAAAGRRVELFCATPGRDLSALAAETVRAAQAARGVVVAVGGDGTLNTVAQAVLGSGCAFGVLPQGTFNYFGRAHGIAADTEAALQRLLNGRAQAVQVGRVNERVFLVNASLGLYPRLLEDREGWKAQLGRSRWVAWTAGLWSLLRGQRSLRLQLAVEGVTREVRTPTLFVGNNALQMEQLGMPLPPGHLAALMLKPVSRWRMLVLLLRGALGRLGEAEQVLSLACTELRVDRRRGLGPRRIKVATDGEVRRMRLPLRFHVADEPLWLIQ